MKRFYKKILLFLLPVFLIWGVTEVFYRTAENNYTFKAKKVIEGYPETELLVFGDSHALYGINPIYFDRKAFSLSNVSQTLYFDELLLKKHLDKHEKLEAVIFTISYFTFSREDNGIEDAWRKYFYDQQMDLDVPIVSKFSPKRYSLALARRFDKSAQLMHEFVENGTILGCTETGYGLHDESNIVDDKDEITPIIVKKHEDGSQDFDHNIKRLQRMIDLCKSRGVQVFIVEMPVYRAYFEQLNVSKRKKVSATAEALAKANANAHYINLIQDNRFLDSDLRDADHLTNEGAEKCTKILNEIIEETLPKKK